MVGRQAILVRSSSRYLFASDIAASPAARYTHLEPITPPAISIVDQIVSSVHTHTIPTHVFHARPDLACFTSRPSPTDSFIRTASPITLPASLFRCPCIQESFTDIHSFNSYPCLLPQAAFSRVNVMNDISKFYGSSSGEKVNYAGYVSYSDITSHASIDCDQQALEVTSLVPPHS